MGDLNIDSPTLFVKVEEELKMAENLSIQDYIRESRNIASLHHQIVDCDQVANLNFAKSLTLTIFFGHCDNVLTKKLTP